MRKQIYIYIIFLLSISISAFSQSEELISKCQKHFTEEYISDGQYYIAKLKNDDIIEFRTTFFGESRYRVGLSTDIDNSTLEFSVFDNEKNLLFKNSNYDYTPYWDFQFYSTVDCIIEVRVKQDTFKKGFVLLLIGFKEEL